MFDCPLNTVRVIRLADGLNGMYLKFHHLAFDGYALYFGGTAQSEGRYVL